LQSLPHHYKVAATAATDGEVSLSAENVEPILSLPPKEFGGPGNRWSPESLLVAAVADCFILSFRAIATASKLSWVSLECGVEGKLERIESITKFTEFILTVNLIIDQDMIEEKAHRMLEKSEAICLITNSLSATTHLTAVVTKAQ
jgi:organic hydroperoxide reductase OsmC/OhrA